mmetsp:Transcript_23712/g.32435  ORF Transcript_23712/g.32435 Transcript_23712/m.32435 type:complete len:212 (+) Transcript_23712:2738-3373(+)
MRSVNCCRPLVRLRACSSTSRMRSPAIIRCRMDTAASTLGSAKEKMRKVTGYTSSSSSGPSSRPSSLSPSSSSCPSLELVSLLRLVGADLGKAGGPGEGFFLELIFLPVYLGDRILEMKVEVRRCTWLMTVTALGCGPRDSSSPTRVLGTSTAFSTFSRPCSLLLLGLAGAGSAVVMGEGSTAAAAGAGSGGGGGREGTGSSVAVSGGTGC